MRPAKHKAHIRAGSWFWVRELDGHAHLFSAAEGFGGNLKLVSEEIEIEPALVVGAVSTAGFERPRERVAVPEDVGFDASSGEKAHAHAVDCTRDAVTRSGHFTSSENWIAVPVFASMNGLAERRRRARTWAMWQCLQ